MSTLSRRTAMSGVAAAMAAPALVRSQAASVRIGLVHPVSGALSFPGQQCRLGATLAVADINAGGGLRSLGGRPIEALLGDAQSRPEIGASVVEDMMSQSVVGLVGAYSSAISLAATQAAARQNIPFCLDGAVAPALTERGMENVFRLFPTNASLVDDALRELDALNKGHGTPIRSAVVIHEDGEFGTNTAKLLAAKLASINVQIKGDIAHATPTRDFSNVALRVKSLAPELVIITSYANEYVLIARSLVQQKVDLAAVFSISGSGFNLKFVKEQPTIAAGIIDFNNWYNPKDPRSRVFRSRVEATGAVFSWEVLYGYFAVRLLADAIEKAGSTDRQKINAALAASQFSDHFLPFGPTRFVNGQNTGAAMVALQAQGTDIKVVAPERYREVEPVFPRPRAS